MNNMIVEIQMNGDYPIAKDIKTNEVYFPLPSVEMLLDYPKGSFCKKHKTATILVDVIETGECINVIDFNTFKAIAREEARTNDKVMDLFIDGFFSLFKPAPTFQCGPLAWLKNMAKNSVFDPEFYLYAYQVCMTLQPHGEIVNWNIAVLGEVSSGMAIAMLLFVKVLHGIRRS